MRAGVAGPYNVAAVGWLVAAALSLLLPPDVRLGTWLPLHLVLAGGVSVAISGNMQSFAAGLSAGPVSGRAWRVIHFALVNAGALLVVLGMTTRTEPLVAVGGLLFTTAAAILGAFVIRAWLRGSNRRHLIAIVLYMAAIASVLAGAGIGALLGSGAVTDPETWLGLRSAHVALNVLGWVSLTIVGTMVTFLPTVIRVRMPSNPPVWAGVLLSAGLALLVLGLISSWSPGSVIGAMAYALGAMLVLGRTVRILLIRRRHRAPVAAWHLAAAVTWFAASTVGLAVGIAREKTFLRSQHDALMFGFVLGWALQALAGAWLYLLPSTHRGDQPRRNLLAAVERGGVFGLIAWNAGLLALIIGSIAGNGILVFAGTGTALFGGLFALARIVTFPRLARTEGTASLARRMWG
jgi:nitrite reductase (NO-forming)